MLVVPCKAVRMEPAMVDFVRLKRFWYDSSTWLAVDGIEALPIRENAQGALRGTRSGDTSWYVRKVSPSQYLVESHFVRVLLTSS